MMTSIDPDFLLDLKNELVEKLRLSRVSRYDLLYPLMNENYKTLDADLDRNRGSLENWGRRTRSVPPSNPSSIEALL